MPRLPGHFHFSAPAARRGDRSNSSGNDPRASLNRSVTDAPRRRARPALFRLCVAHTTNEHWQKVIQLVSTGTIFLGQDSEPLSQAQGN
jgi:hypothetical protein